MTDQPCPFCEINLGRAPATFVHEWSDAFAITPLSPVVEGHTLVIPKMHVTDFVAEPAVSAAVMKRAAELAGGFPAGSMNLITSRGRAATQSVFHLHLHLVPRAENDGLALPWYSGRTKTGRPPVTPARTCARRSTIAATAALTAGVWLAPDSWPAALIALYIAVVLAWNARGHMRRHRASGGDCDRARRIAFPDPQPDPRPVLPRRDTYRLNPDDQQTFDEIARSYNNRSTR